MNKAVLKNCSMFTGKQLCQSLFLISLQAWRPPTFLKKRLQHRCFPVNIERFLRTSILNSICEQLLLLSGGFPLMLRHSIDFKSKNTSLYQRWS